MALPRHDLAQRLPGRKALFTVAGCTGYGMDGRLRASQAAASVGAGEPA